MKACTCTYASTLDHADPRDAALPGAHIALLVESAEHVGWGLLTVHDEGLALAGTVVTGDATFRLLTSPDYDGALVLLQVEDYSRQDVREEVAMALTSKQQLQALELATLEAPPLF